MYYNSDNQTISITKSDYSKLSKIVEHLIHEAEMPELGLYSVMSQDVLWMNLIFQFCAISGRRMTDALRNDKKQLYDFSEKLNFKYLASIKNNRKEYIAKVLKDYKATSFYNKQAERIDDILKSPNVVDKNKFVLLNGIDHNKQSYNEIRDILIRRVPHLKMKSASGFMIENGLAIDVIAISTRIWEVLNKHFDLRLDNRKIQSSRKTYLAIEDALRKACGHIGIPLAYLSRMLFQYSEKDTVSFILEDL